MRRGWHRRATTGTARRMPGRSGVPRRCRGLVDAGRGMPRRDGGALLVHRLDVQVDELLATLLADFLDRGLRGQRVARPHLRDEADRSEEHTSELQSLLRISYAVF